MGTQRIDESKYLTGMPESFADHGLCKTLMVRRLSIDIKHIFTELFIRKTLGVNEILSKIGMDLFGYMEYMTQQLRKTFKVTRHVFQDPDRVVKQDDCRFFDSMSLFSDLNSVLVLDFDGVCTKFGFASLYELCCQRSKTIICTANPTVTPDWFRSKGMTIPSQIHACKGKVAKMKRLIELNKKYDVMFYIDDEEEYLTFAWIFGIKTYKYTNGSIKMFSLKSK